MNEDNYVEGAWYWVTDGNVTWPAKRDARRSVGGWTNEDTWEDFDGSVIRAERIHPPSWLRHPKGGLL